MKKEARVHRLSTEDSMSSPFYVDKHNNIYEWGEDLKASGTPQHLYITTDEEIKEGDWCLFFDSVGNLFTDRPQQYLGEKAGHTLNDGLRKIIATTDPKLHTNEVVEEDMHMYKKSLPLIPQSFIEKYCKAGGIDEVLVEYTTKIVEGTDLGNKCHYVKPDKPKLNPDNTITIHPIKDSWSRDELLNILLTFSHYINDINDVVLIEGATVNRWMEDSI